MSIQHGHVWLPGWPLEGGGSPPSTASAAHGRAPATAHCNSPRFLSNCRYGQRHEQLEEELDKQPPRLQRGSAGSLSDAAAHEQAEAAAPQRRRQPQAQLEQQPRQLPPRLPPSAEQQAAEDSGVLGTWAGRQRIFAEHLRQQEQEVEAQRARPPPAPGRHASESPTVTSAAAAAGDSSGAEGGAGSSDDEAGLPEASLRQHGNTPVVLAAPPLPRPAPAAATEIPEPTLDAEMNAAWRWRFTRKWQAEQMKQFEAAPQGGGGGDDEEEWAAALRLMNATDGLNMQIGRTLSLHTSSVADGSMGLEQSLTLISPMDQSLSQCMLLDMDGSVKEVGGRAGRVGGWVWCTCPSWVEGACSRIQFAAQLHPLGLH